MPIVEVVEFLQQHQLQVATAESCTAGLIAAMMADVSGCGSVLEGGYVVYTKEAKHNYLGVSLQAIETYGLTSEEVARAMVKGLSQRTHANFFIAVTGTAESDDELNGVVCFAYGLSIRNGLAVMSETLKFDGDRNRVRKAAAQHAINSLPAIYTMLTSESASNQNNI